MCSLISARAGPVAGKAVQILTTEQMSKQDVTAWLIAWGEGAAGADNRLIEAVYADLRKVARRRLRAERADHSLTPTALVHDAYIRLVDLRRVRWQNRAQFFAVAARLMRRLLVDHARAHAAVKRGGAAWQSTAVRRYRSHGCT